MLGCTLDQAGNVRDDEAVRALKIHNTEIRMKRRKMIIRNLRARVRNTREEGGFSYVRIADEADIRDDLLSLTTLYEKTGMATFPSLRSFVI